MSNYRIVKATEAIQDDHGEWTIPYRIERRVRVFPLIPVKRWVWVYGQKTYTAITPNGNVYTETKSEPLNFHSEGEAMKFISAQYETKPEQEIAWDVVKELAIG